MPSYAWSVQFPDNLKTAVEALARRQHRTTAEQVRYLLERAIANEAMKGREAGQHG
jgi:hypothetical protein